MSEHRHFPPGIPEHDEEPQLGLPERLPSDEKLLWQGQPDARLVGLHIVHLRAVAVYFLLLLAAQAYGVWQDTAQLSAVLSALLKSLPFVLLAIAAFVYLAACIARNTVYTVTSKRIVMRIGIALTITYNLPYSRIASADLLKRPGGGGDLSFTLQKEDKIPWLNLWPHARPWRIAHPQPSFRCLADVEPVAQIVTQAWLAQRNQLAKNQVRLANGYNGSSIVPSAS